MSEAETAALRNWLFRELGSSQSTQLSWRLESDTQKGEESHVVEQGREGDSSLHPKGTALLLQAYVI